MIKGREKEGDFYDGYVYRHLLPEEHILLEIKEKIDFGFVNEELKDLYNLKYGRPGYLPEVLFKMLFLEYYYGLSDVEVAKQCRYNILYRYFLGLGIKDETPDDTTLVVFRRRMGEEKLKQIFERLIDICKEKGLLKRRLKFVDATAIVADIAIPNTINLLRQGRKVIVKKILREKPEYKEELGRYIETSKEEGIEGLEEEVKVCEEFLDKVKRDRYSTETEELIEALEEMVKKGGERGKVVSFIDPDARSGAKNRKERFYGYKAGIAADESGIVTTVDVMKGNENEGKRLEKVIKEEKGRGIESEAIVADRQYSSARNREVIEKEGMKAYIPNAKTKTKLEEGGFKYQEGEDVVECKEGKRSSGKTRQMGGKVYRFSTKTCRDCKARASCAGRERRGWVRIMVSDDYLHYLRSRDEFYEEAQRRRKLIERKIGEAKKWHGLGRARYRGLSKVKIQVFMTFIVINIKRMIKIMKEGMVRERCQDLALAYG